MDRTKAENELGLLTGAIERSLKRTIDSPKDFEYLRACIYARLHTLLSVSTLKRVWGYMPRGELRTSTLDTLASFIGHGSWEQFLRSNAEGEASCYMLGRHVTENEELNPGERLVLTWHPDRRCEALYRGEYEFEVTASENTRLQPGDTFSCRMVIEGEPLYLDGLVQQGCPPVGYVCGRLGGVRFELPDSAEHA